MITHHVSLPSFLPTTTSVICLRLIILLCIIISFYFLCNCNCATRLLVVQSYGGSFVSNYNKNHEIEIDTGMRIRNEMVKYEVYNLIVTSTVIKCLLSILIVISTVFKCLLFKKIMRSIAANRHQKEQIRTFLNNCQSMSTQDETA